MRIIFFLIVFLLEIFSLRLLPEAKISLYSTYNKIAQNIESNIFHTGGLPQDRRKTAPEIRKYIRAIIFISLLTLFLVVLYNSSYFKGLLGQVILFKIIYKIIFPDFRKIVAYFYNYRSYT